MYETALFVTPQDQARHPFEVRVRATGEDFFPMFEVPWRYGAAWTHADSEARAHVAVISSQLNERLFDGQNSVGAVLRLGDADYRVVGVLGDWWPMPRFYDMSVPFVRPEDVFIPFTLAIEQRLSPAGAWACRASPEPGWDGFLRSDCAWLQMWAELPTAADARYRQWLAAYADEQQRIGRLHWPARTQLRNVRQWLDYHHVVLSEVSLLVLVSLGFLCVCLLNAMSLMLAKILGGARDIALRRALGARRLAVLSQCVVETAVVGLVGGALGLLLTELALLRLRQLITPGVEKLLQLDAFDIGMTVLLAVVATTLAGLYPAWRAVRLPPAPQLKTL
jgi:putative ABC transport system permease protein